MKLSTDLETYRVKSGPFATEKGETYGAFIIPYKNYYIKVISSGENDEYKWEHVSISLNNRTPNWEEMCYIKSLFWNDEETVIQLHPPKSQWINNHPHCLHLWRPIDIEIPLPPSITVGLKELNIK